jgi:hypothetical protein
MSYGAIERIRRENKLRELAAKGYQKREGPCSECGAEPIYAKGMCRRCYQRVRNLSQEYWPMKGVQCAECGEQAYAKGLCHRCYDRNRAARKKAERDQALRGGTR